MIKNVALKIVLQNIMSSVGSVINRISKHNDKKIMLYSNLGFRDNIKALYDHIIEFGYNEKYTIICSTNDYKKYSSSCNYPNVKFCSNVRGIIEYFSASYVYYCFGKIPILPSKEQKVVQMWHGSPYKAPDEGMLKGHSLKMQYYTNVLSASENFAPFWSYALSVPIEHVIICGQPRCDVLFKKTPEYDFGDYDKLILWTPTFRKSSISGYNDTKEQANIVPVLSKEDISFVNEALKPLRVKILVKLHPLQSLDDYNYVNDENFVLISHSDFVKNNMDLYVLMKQADALITDYSSIFYDYLLLDRPIAFTEDDMEDYGSTRGFAVDDPDGYKPGFRIKTKEDLINFAKDLALGIDNYSEDRKRVQSLSNDYLNGGYCERAFNSIGISL